MQLCGQKLEELRCLRLARRQRHHRASMAHSRRKGRPPRARAARGIKYSTAFLYQVQWSADGIVRGRRLWLLCTCAAFAFSNSARVYMVGGSTYPSQPAGRQPQRCRARIACTK